MDLDKKYRDSTAERKEVERNSNMRRLVELEEKAKLDRVRRDEDNFIIVVESLT